MNVILRLPDDQSVRLNNYDSLEQAIEKIKSADWIIVTKKTANSLP